MKSRKQKRDAFSYRKNMQMQTFPIRHFSKSHIFSYEETSHFRSLDLTAVEEEGYIACVTVTVVCTPIYETYSLNILLQL